MPHPPALHRALSAHRAVFGTPAAIAALAPGRVNLIGEHTDYNDGFVLPMAIESCCAAAVSPREDGRLRIIAADLPAPRNAVELILAEIDPASLRGDWPAYVAGPAALLAARASRTVGADVAIASDVPIGAGLSSSAAAEVSIATALAALWQVSPPPLELARLCQRAEHEYAGVPCGLMDQLASVMGREGHALRIDCRDNLVLPIALPDASRLAIVVANSGVRHALAGGEYAARRAACHAAARAMGLHSLREATEARLDAATMPDDQRECALHIIRENARVLAFAEALGAGNLAAAGARMFESHESLRDLYRVSCAELDTLVAAARTVPGVFGSRLTGGGFGGCTVTLCAPGAVGPLADALRTRSHAAHGRACEVFTVRAAQGARRVDLPAH